MISTFFIILGFINQVFVLVQVSAKNPIHRIAAQVQIFQTGSFIFIQLDNYIQGLTYIIVYVGAIAIQFQFVIMLIEHPSVGYNSSKKKNIKKHQTVLTYPINNLKKDYRGIVKEISFNNSYNKNKKIKEKIISYNFCDIANSKNKNKLINIKNYYKHSKISESIQNSIVLKKDIISIIIILFSIFFQYYPIIGDHLREIKQLQIKIIEEVQEGDFFKEIPTRWNFIGIPVSFLSIKKCILYSDVIDFCNSSEHTFKSKSIQMIYFILSEVRLYLQDSIYWDTPIATPISIFPNLFFPNLDFYNYFYPVWAIEFKNITDIETQGILIYVAYPFAQIQVSIALWTVMIGIISICSPRRL